RLAAGVGFLLQTLRPGERCGAELPVTLCLSHGDQQRPDPGHGPNPCELPLERPQVRRVANRAAAGRGVSEALSPARPAARLSQGALLWALASLEARTVRSCLVAVDAGQSRQGVGGRQPVRGIEAVAGPGRSPPGRGAGA